MKTFASLEGFKRYNDYTKEHINTEFESNLDKSAHYCGVVIEDNKCTYCGNDFEFAYVLKILN